MTKYFAICTTLEEVKTTFHKLAKQLHPDNGGDPEQFKIMMAEYTIAFNTYKNIHKNHEGQTYTKETNETPEQFADLIKEHNGDGLGILAAVCDGNDDGAYSCYGHEEVFIEDLTIPDAQSRTPQNIIANQQIGDHVKNESGPAMYW